MKVKSSYLILLTLLILPVSGFSSPLQIHQTWPSGNAIDVERDTQIIVKFNKKVKPWSVNHQTFKVKDSNGQRVKGKIRLNKYKRKAIFTRGIRDLSNERLARQVFRFTVRDGLWGEQLIISNSEPTWQDNPRPKIATGVNGHALAVWSQDESFNNLSTWGNQFDPKTNTWGTPQLIILILIQVIGEM